MTLPGIINQPTVAGPWNTPIAGRGLRRDERATELFRRAALEMPGEDGGEVGKPVAFGAMNDERYIVHECDAKTPTYRVNVKHKGGDQLKGTRVPIPRGMKLPDIATVVDQNYCAVRVTRGADAAPRVEMFDTIEMVPPRMFGAIGAWLGLDKYTVSKAAWFVEGEEWKPLAWSQMTAVMSGFPLTALLTRPDTMMRRAMAVTFAPEMFYAPSCGPGAVTGGASDTDGKVPRLDLPGVKAGQMFRVDEDFDTTGMGRIARLVVETGKWYGFLPIMSGAPLTNAMKTPVWAGSLAACGAVKEDFRGLERITSEVLHCVG